MNAFEKWSKEQAEIFNRLDERIQARQREAVLFAQSRQGKTRFASSEAWMNTFALAAHISILPVRNRAVMFHRLQQAPLLKHRIARRVMRVAQQLR